MIGMVIADDELIIRQGLQTIPWNDYGIKIKGVAANGEEALSLVKCEHPEILLTDIRMPGMDGLKLIAAVKSEMLGIKAILLTGYQDFGYAHKAIQLGAFGYVLKPSDPEEIINLVLKAKEQVEVERREELEKAEMALQVDIAKSSMLNTFLQDLIYGRNTDIKDISEKCTELNINLENYVVMAAELGIKDGMLSSELITNLKEGICEISTGYNRSYVLDTGRSVYCIINKVSEEDKPLKDKMISLAMEIRNYVKSKFDIYISIGISKCFDNTAHMYAAYNQAMNCLKMKFSLGKGAIIHVEDLMDSLNRQKVLPLELSGEIVENIKLGNYRKVEDLTREMLFRLSKEQKAGEQMIKGICFDILASSLRVLKDERTTGHMKSGEKYFHSILNECTDVEELEEYLISTLMNIMDSIHLNTVSEENKTIDEILDYIDKFYMNDISLLTVSEYVYMNHIYVSRLIKKETGETFLDILTRMRMKKACELLVNSSSKIYEISNSVGIKDSGYFSQVFKKYQGVTPSEYRENISSRLNNTEAKS